MESGVPFSSQRQELDTVLPFFLGTAQDNQEDIFDHLANLSWSVANDE
jgi:hypothetical protein